MNWVKTKLVITDKGIKIRKPQLSYNYVDFYKFKVDQEDDYYIVYITLNDEKMIVFKTKVDISELILEKFNAQGLVYDSVI